jgi:arsenite methyltransferase
MNRRSGSFSTACLCLLVLAPPRLAGQAKPTTMEEMHKLHQDSKAYIAMLEDPARDAYQKPHEVVMALGLKDGERIADIGAGSGYFALRFAQHVGPAGQVLAVDINPDMILHLNQRIRDARVENVRTILALPGDPLLAPSSVDRIFICETWHHIADHPQYLALLKKTLKPGGQVVIVDFHKKPTPGGPPPEMRISREDVLKEFEQGGFRLLEEHGFLPYQYFLVFAPADRRVGEAGRGAGDPPGAGDRERGGVERDAAILAIW